MVVLRGVVHHGKVIGVLVERAWIGEFLVHLPNKEQLRCIDCPKRACRGMLRKSRRPFIGMERKSLLESPWKSALGRVARCIKKNRVFYKVFWAKKWGHSLLFPPREENHVSKSLWKSFGTSQDEQKHKSFVQQVFWLKYGGILFCSPHEKKITSRRACGKALGRRKMNRNIRVLYSRCFGLKYGGILSCPPPSPRSQALQSRRSTCKTFWYIYILLLF